jgi:apolipoprotein N-acyltransferase
VAFAIFGVAGAALPVLVPVAIIAFIGFLGCILFLFFALRCPNCRGNMGYTIQWPPSMWGVSERIKYCPFCAIELDTDEKDLRTTQSKGT